jgi:type IV pilus assembly protein PilA
MFGTRRHIGAFTLIELLIVVALIGVLSAVAIPNYLRYQLRSKSSEAVTNLAALALAEELFFTEKGCSGRQIF